MLPHRAGPAVIEAIDGSAIPLGLSPQRFWKAPVLAEVTFCHVVLAAVWSADS
jgi:hypothetical protein